MEFSIDLTSGERHIFTSSSAQISDSLDYSLTKLKISWLNDEFIEIISFYVIVFPVAFNM